MAGKRNFHVISSSILTHRRVGEDVPNTRLLSLFWRARAALSTIQVSISDQIEHEGGRRSRCDPRTHSLHASPITILDTSLSPIDTLRALQSYQWKIYDLQWLCLAVVGILGLSMNQSLRCSEKMAIAAFLLGSLILPLTRQIFRPFMPMATYLIWFSAYKFIPANWRPAIEVKFLHRIDSMLFGTTLSRMFSAHENTFLDLLAWFPYGVVHFLAPFACPLLLFIYGPPTTASNFTFALGYMTLISLVVQILFPCSPPWYEEKYGFVPASYFIQGFPAGLARIDTFFNLDLYTSSFRALPVVFGAFPSIHAASSVLEALFMSHVFPKLRGVFAFYVVWLGWSTVYLSHHYTADLIAGVTLAVGILKFTKARFLPPLQPNKKYRWDYDHVEIGDRISTNGT